MLVGSSPGAFSCFNNNILRIDCWWAAPDWAQKSDPWLLFTNNHKPASQHRCTFQAGVCTVELPPEEVLVPSDNFTITLHHHVSGKEQVTLLFPQYLPRKYVKLDPPSDLQSNVSSDHCVLTWAINPALEPLSPLLSYELAFKRKEEAWEQARQKDRIVGVSWLILEAIELKPGSTYEARLRVQMEAEMEEEEHYEGQWSEWSQPVCFPSPQRPGSLTPPLGQPNSILVSVSILFLLTSLTYFLFKLTPRVKRTFCQHVPSPAAFFQPLYSVHNGNFQTWMGAHKAALKPKEASASISSGASESNTLEAIAVLTWDPATSWRTLGVEASRDAGLPEEAPLAAHTGTGPPLAYLPQEDWVPASPTSPACEETGASSSDYCALSGYSRGYPAGPPGMWQSSVPILARAWGLPCNQSSWDAQQGCPCVGAGHDLMRDPGNLHEEGRDIFLHLLADCTLCHTESSEVLSSGQRTTSSRADP
ncbi:interleukin-9 receptor [Sorex fumeus]|uniref:interleukin-9 receptor n=1 Tax=Sorex fumeus TaxID=62283 RepID=UPI0024AD0DF2|nr:interleukin-9 receptor [Sorex fumeus]